MFSFSYLQFLQPDLIAQEQYFFSRGETTYNPLLGSFLITAVLCAVGVAVGKIVRFPTLCVSVAWCFPCYLLALYTSMDFQNGGADVFDFSSAILLFILYLLVGAAGGMASDFFGSKGKLADDLPLNMYIMAVSMFLVAGLGNVDPYVHKELKMARLANHKMFDEALDVCQKGVMSERMASIASLSLMEKGELGDRLFTLSLPKGTGFLLPPTDDSLFISYPERGIYAKLKAKPADRDRWTATGFLSHVSQMDSARHDASRQLLLCSYLLDRDVTGFVKELLSETDSLDAVSLPRHYREALVLHKRRNNEPFIEYSDDEVETNYEDYHRYISKYLSREQKRYCSQDLFQNTYWNYYFFMH